MLGLENRILRKIAEGATLEDTIAALCKEMEAQAPGLICTVMTADCADLLYPLAAPSLSERFLEIIDAAPVAGVVGSNRIAAYPDRPILVEEIAADAEWAKFATSALPSGVKACWSSPLYGDDAAVVGLVAVYCGEHREPSATERALIATCIELCEIAMRRHGRSTDGERRASVDALTGLPNRAAFNAVLARLPGDAPGSWALLVIDLDNLKVVNDTFGHEVGDALIRTAAQRIAKSVFPNVAFRLGGDEFAVVIKEVEALADLHVTAQRIFDSLGIAADCNGHTVIPMATIGGAALEPADFSAEAVYRNADFALYHAKETGRGGFVRYWPGIGTRITQRRDAIRDVSAALSDGRIETYYQPAIALDCREILGVEALCRLKTRSGQIVAAHLFQEATSDASVATALTGRMLESVAQDLRGWMDDGIPVRHVGINVSAADFRSGRLMNQLDESFGRAGVPFDRLILEVSESIYTDQRDKVMEREIAALRERGIVVALDDFGTDYASLTRLMRVPIDAIKIDQSFVARLWPGDPSTIIVQGLIDIAREMDIAVVAKGIETEVQASQLWAMGCRVGQGFAFSQVHDRKTTTELLRRHAHGLRNAIPLYRDRPGQPGQAAAQKSELRPTGTV